MFEQHFKSKLFQRRSLIAFIFIFVVIGTVFLLAARAATSTASLEPESGTLSGNVSTIIDSTASNGSAVQFGTSSSSCPTGPAGSLAIHVCGNHLVNASSQTIRLRGADVSGTEFACVQGNSDPYGGAPFGTLQTFQVMSTWGINVIRVPLNEDCWLGINNPSVGGSTYQAAIAQEVSVAHQAGLYVILDLHWSAPSTYLANGQNYGPDTDHSITFWQQVATAYKNDPGVIFDLYNEPIQNYVSSNPWSCWLNGCSVTQYLNNLTGTTIPAYQLAGVNQIITAIRGVGATQPVLVNGIDWANDDTQWLANAPTDPDKQVIAGAHIYPGQCDGFDNTCNGGGAPLSTRVANWNAVYPSIGATYPILIGETGDHTSAPVAFLPTFLPYADAHNWSYLTWTWNNWGDPDDVLLSKVYNDNQDYSSPTPNAGEGSCYKNWLLSGHCP